MAKNIIKTIVSVTILSVCVLSSPVPLSAQAQDVTPLPGDLDFLEVADCKLYTSTIFEDGSPSYWTGKDMHTGIQVFSLIFRNGKEIPRDFTSPEKPTFVFSILDPEGNEVGSTTKDISSDFRKLKYTTKFTANYSSSLCVNRGGQYKVAAGISPELFSYEKDMILNEEAGAQVSDYISRADSILCPKVTITSGYPYDPMSVAGKHSLRWAASKQDEPEVMIADNTIPFELTSGTPLLAAVAELTLEVPDLEPGEYIFTLSSDYTPANRSFKARVNDYLRVEASFNKTLYKSVEDKNAILKMDMNYGFPYIKVSSSTNKPTIYVTTDLQGESTTTEFSNDAWADAPIHYTADVVIPLQSVTQEIVESYEGKVPLTVSVAFNNDLQYKAIMIIPFEYNSSGIENVTSDSSLSKDVRFFNLMGLEVDENYKGFVITSDGHKLIRH